MDQYRSRLKLSEKFERHWSIRISGEIHMDQSLVHTFSWGNLNGPMVPKVLLRFPPTLVLVHGWLFPERLFRRSVTRIDMHCQQQSAEPVGADQSSAVLAAAKRTRLTADVQNGSSRADAAGTRRHSLVEVAGNPSKNLYHQHQNFCNTIKNSCEELIS